ncbi:MAG: hypothetical protein Q8L68_00945 [Methylococcales bacterium]|nr:hypothetical protein [Methylococcales bacterium]
MTTMDMPMMAEIHTVEPLTATIFRVLLQPEHYVPYLAGQYLQILTNQEALSYSIANAPLGAHQYEIHLRHVKTNLLHQRLLQDMRTEGELPIFLPLGECHIGKLSLQQPILWIAQGTGFSPAKAMIEYCLAEQSTAPLALCWLARVSADWYLESLVHEWEVRVPNFRYLPMLLQREDAALIDHMLAWSEFRVEDLQVVLSGPFDRMCALKALLLARGLRASQLFSDAF